MTADPVLLKLAQRVKAVQAAQRAALDSGRGPGKSRRPMDKALLAASIGLENALDVDCRKFLGRTAGEPTPALELADLFRRTLKAQRLVWVGTATADQRREARDYEQRLAAAVKAILEPPTPGLFDNPPDATE